MLDWHTTKVKERLGEERRLDKCLDERRSGKTFGQSGTAEAQESDKNVFRSN